MSPPATHPTTYLCRQLLLVSAGSVQLSLLCVHALLHLGDGGPQLLQLSGRLLGLLPQLEHQALPLRKRRCGCLRTLHGHGGCRLRLCQLLLQRRHLLVAPQLAHGVLQQVQV